MLCNYLLVNQEGPSELCSHPRSRLGSSSPEKRSMDLPLGTRSPGQSSFPPARPFCSKLMTLKSLRALEQLRGRGLPRPSFRDRQIHRPLHLQR